MPELPEVETVRKILNKWLIDKTIIAVDFFYDDVLSNMGIDEFKKKIINQKINNIGRRGKFLLFNLDNYVLLSHLRMEGKYYLVKEIEKNSKIDKHKICSFHLDDGNQLIYHDVRKFGRMKLLENESFELDPSLTNLGEEPFTLDWEIFYNKIKKSRREIKKILLDQNIIAGLGNIYVDEVLFKSLISPLRRANEISKKEAKTLIQNSIIVLNKAIEAGGSTVRSYRFGGEAEGRFQNELYVYGRSNQNCYVCNSKIKKIVVGGRGTHYCSKCQK